MFWTVPEAALAGLAAPFLQLAVLVGLAATCFWLFARYRARHFAYWGVAWSVYALRLVAISSFLLTERALWLYWHQVTTGWTAVALLWAALVFSLGLRFRPMYLWALAFPPLWSYVAIYRLDHFLWAAAPAVAFLSGATAWTAWTFYRHDRRVRSGSARMLAVTFGLWALHHLDYPFLRGRGVWNPWGYYVDILLALGAGLGLVALVLDDLQRGLRTLSDLSGDLQRAGAGGDVTGALLGRPLSLPAVQGTALYDGASGAFVRGAGSASEWGGTRPEGVLAEAIASTAASGLPRVERRAEGRTYVAVLPIFAGGEAAPDADPGTGLPTGALVITGEASDPFTVLDDAFLVALGQQVGAALRNGSLYGLLRDRTRDLEGVRERLVHRTEEERQRLSRELHDETAQVFAALSLELGVLEEAAPAGLAPRFRRATELVKDGIASIRSVTEELRPSLLDDLGLVPALGALLDDFAERSGLVVERDLPRGPLALGDAGELALFRALQEALANVVRHADARTVEVRLSRLGDRVVLVVRDDGRGIRDPGADADGAGITGMRERLTALGGDLEFESGEPGRGAVLTARLPVAG